MLMDLPDEYWDYIYKEFKKFESKKEEQRYCYPSRKPRRIQYTSLVRDLCLVISWIISFIYFLCSSCFFICIPPFRDYRTFVCFNIHQTYVLCKEIEYVILCSFVDFEIPVKVASCRADTFLLYIISASNIFILILLLLFCFYSKSEF